MASPKTVTDSAGGCDPGPAPGRHDAPSRTRTRVRLAYTFETQGQQGAALANPLFDLLAAVTQGGSIKAAASLLRASYRHVWGQLRHWEATLGEPLVSWSQGQPARLTDFAQRLLAEERRARTRMQPHIEALRADLERVVVTARDTRQQVLSLRASHDLALPILQQHLASTAGVHLDIGFLGSVDSLKALSERQCLIAGFHVPTELAATPVFGRALLPWLRPRTHRLIACARRIQGLMMRPELAGAVKSLKDVSRLHLRFVSRQAGSGTRMLIDHLLHLEGLSPGRLGGDRHIEQTHVAVALCVASGVADVGMGIEAAAGQLGLHFVPLVREDYFLASAASDLNHPGLKQLREVLAGGAWRSILTSLRGYEPPADPGSLKRIEQVFPWWPQGR